MLEILAVLFYGEKKATKTTWKNHRDLENWKFYGFQILQRLGRFENIKFYLSFKTESALKGNGIYLIAPVESFLWKIA